MENGRESGVKEEAPLDDNLQWRGIDCDATRPGCAFI